MLRKPAPEIGTREWLRWEASWGERGLVDAALCLFEQQLISRAKCRNILRGMLVYPQDERAALNAPWERLDWSGEPAAEDAS